MVQREVDIVDLLIGSGGFAAQMDGREVAIIRKGVDGESRLLVAETADHFAADLYFLAVELVLEAVVEGHERAVVERQGDLHFSIVSVIHVYDSGMFAETVYLDGLIIVVNEIGRPLRIDMMLLRLIQQAAFKV